jgi:hypothetical protein
MAMKQRGGTKSKTIDGMLNVFQSTFSRSGMKQCLEFALAKLRGLCKYLASAYNSNSHVCGLHCLRLLHRRERLITSIATPVLLPSPLNSQHLHFSFTVASLSKILVRSRRDWEKKCRIGIRQILTQILARNYIFKTEDNVPAGKL